MKSYCLCYKSKLAISLVHTVIHSKAWGSRTKFTEVFHTFLCPEPQLKRSYIRYYATAAHGVL